jgi:hypothetical protein
MIKHIPRIIGVILLAIAGFTIYLKSTSAILFLLAGLILLLTKKKTAELNFKLFKQSFDSKAIVTALIEAVNLVGFFGILLAVSKFLEKSAIAAMAGTDFAALASALAMKQNVAAAESFFTSLLITTIAAVIAYLLLYTITRYFIWKILAKKQNFWKFLLVNLIWWVIWLPIIVLVFIGTRPEVAPYLFIIMTFAYIYLTFFIHYAYFTKQKIIQTTLHNAFSNKYLVPLAYAFTLFIVASQALRLHLATGAILLMVWLCWARYYFFVVSKKH